MIARSPRAPVPRRIAWSAMASSASSVNSSSTPSSSNSRWYCRTSALRGSVRIRISASRSRLCTRGDHRQPADELRDHAELEQVLGHDLGEHVAGVDRRPWSAWRRRSRALLADALLDDLLQAGERTAHDEQHVGRVDLDELLVRVLAPALRRHRRGRALEDLQQRLLHALAGDVAGDRRVLALAGDLVDLVDVDDPGLGLLDVVVGGLDQLEQDVLDVLADVAGLGQRRGVGDGERHVEHAREGLGEQRLAASRWGRAAGCWTWRARPASSRPAVRRRRPAPACSGCRRRPTAPSSPTPAR